MMRQRVWQLQLKKHLSFSDEEVLRQVEQDRINLSELVGYEVEGMAYPCGGKTAMTW